MKILTKEEERAHQSATYRGGTIGGVAGLAVGYVGVVAASRRYHFFRDLTLPLKAFLVTSSGTFAGIIAADHASRSFELKRNPKELAYREAQAQRYEAEHSGMTFTQRAMEFGKKERYKIVGASWVASILAAFAMVNRNKYLTGAQKLVQARVYAQFLTLGVLIASAAFEISDSKNDEGKLWETVRYIDPNDPEHKRIIEKEQRKEGAAGGTDGDTLWKEMVAAEEERLKEREERQKELKHEKGAKHAKKSGKKENGDGKGKSE
jgi:Hypoxia induced protein conserved region